MRRPAEVTFGALRMHLRECIFLNPASNVLQDARAVGAGSDDHADMGQIALKDPGEQVAGLQRAGEGVAVGLILRGPELGAGASPENLKIQDTAMVDVGVGRMQTPGPRIGCEVALHVFVDKTLQVEPKPVASSPDDDIGADAGRARNIAVWIGDAGVGGVVAGGDAELGAGGFSQARAVVARRNYYSQESVGEEGSAVHGCLDTATAHFAPGKESDMGPHHY